MANLLKTILISTLVLNCVFNATYEQPEFVHPDITLATEATPPPIHEQSVTCEGCKVVGLGGRDFDPDAMILVGPGLFWLRPELGALYRILDGTEKVLTESEYHKKRDEKSQLTAIACDSKSIQTWHIESWPKSYLDCNRLNLYFLYDSGFARYIGGPDRDTRAKAYARALNNAKLIYNGIEREFVSEEVCLRGKDLWEVISPQPVNRDILSARPPEPRLTLVKSRETKIWHILVGVPEKVSEPPFLLERANLYEIPFGL